MKTYKLLTPGPLTTTDSVKQEMLFDHCTWDEDYKQITQRIRRELLQLAHVDETAYTTVLMQGSGTFGVESVISSVIPEDGCLLLLSNGAYGERIAAMCRYHHINCVHIAQDYDKIPDRMKAEEALQQHPEITHIAMIHSETTTGILNDIQSIGELAKTYHKVFIVDAMSSFAGVDIPMHDWHIDFLVSSANKCIQGFQASPLSSQEESCWSLLKAVHAACPWTCTISGPAWRRMENGAIPLLRMLFWHLPRRWRSCKRKAVFLQEVNAMHIIVMY